MATPTGISRWQRHLMVRFLRQIGDGSDTPSLIVTIAADADYMWLCRAIIDPQATDPALCAGLESVCREHGWRLNRIQALITPAARALGLVRTVHEDRDFYRVLGVGPKADAGQIKRAFRQKAVAVHPDANTGPTDGGRHFVELSDAYRTLRDPVSRRKYDADRRQRLSWQERADRTIVNDQAPSLFFWYLWALFLVFILLLLALKFIGVGSNVPDSAGLAPSMESRRFDGRIQNSKELILHDDSGNRGYWGLANGATLKERWLFNRGLQLDRRFRSWVSFEINASKSSCLCSG